MRYSVKKTCEYCGRELNKSEIKESRKRCLSCRQSKQISRLLSVENLAITFEKYWSTKLLLQYNKFLEIRNLSPDTKRRNILCAIRILSLAEKQFLISGNITPDWLNNDPNIAKDVDKIKASFFPFLVEEKVLKPMPTGDIKIERITRLIECIPTSFRRLIQLYLDEMLSLREKQIRMGALKPLTLNSILSDIQTFNRLINWIKLNCDISSWDMLQEMHVQDYLLSLKLSVRQQAIKNLLLLFNLAKRKRIITHVPVIDTLIRELPPSTPALSFEELKRIAKLIEDNSSAKPLAALLISFSFYHGLSPSQISKIRLTDVDISHKKIAISGRPPIFMSDHELETLQQYLSERSNIKSIETRTYLVVRKIGVRGLYEDKPIKTGFINELVKVVTGHTPRTLRMNCFYSFAANYGPQILIEAFGLSITNAKRFGKFEDYLIEDEIKSQKSL
ncbi:MAG: site-specific integrase [Sporomusa sp.]|jgi:integrase|nr:site-specific integrase [Sporomusa sp.]